MSVGDFYHVFGTAGRSVWYIVGDQVPVFNVLDDSSVDGVAAICNVYKTVAVVDM